MQDNVDKQSIVFQTYIQNRLQKHASTNNSARQLNQKSPQMRRTRSKYKVIQIELRDRDRAKHSSPSRRDAHTPSLPPIVLPAAVSAAMPAVRSILIRSLASSSVLLLLLLLLILLLLLLKLLLL